MSMQARQAVEAALQQASEAAQRLGEREIELEQAEAQLAGRLAAAAALEARLRHQQVAVCSNCARAEACWLLQGMRPRMCAACAVCALKLDRDTAQPAA